MGASESKPTTNGANQEDDERKQEYGASSTGLFKAAAAVAAIASVGVAAYNMSQTRYKMQTDGSCRPTWSSLDGTVKRGPSGFDGILRDDRGRWVRGFIGFIGISDCLTSEIYGIYNGLLLLETLGLKGSVLESDCEPAIDLIKKESSYNSKSKVVIDCGDMIKDCRRLVAENQITISHCFKNANKCADKLAEMAVEKKIEYKEYIKDVPYEIQQILDRESST